jgi:hypothetical protein
MADEAILVLLVDDEKSVLRSMEKSIISKICGNGLTRNLSRSSNDPPYFSWQATLDTGALLVYAQR